jgi:hypothetical protein
VSTWKQSTIRWSVGSLNLGHHASGYLSCQCLAAAPSAQNWMLSRLGHNSNTCMAYKLATDTLHCAAPAPVCFCFVWDAICDLEPRPCSTTTHVLIFVHCLKQLASLPAPLLSGLTLLLLIFPQLVYVDEWRGWVKRLVAHDLLG